MWARGLSGGDPQRAIAILSLYHALPDPSFKSFLGEIAKDDQKLAFTKTHLAKLGPPFERARFDLFYERPDDIDRIQGLLTLAMPWTVADVTTLLGGAAKSVSKALQSALLTVCTARGWTHADVTNLLNGLVKECVAAICDTPALQAQVDAQRITWKFGEVREVVSLLWAKQPAPAVVARFLKNTVAGGYQHSDAKKLVNGLSADALGVITQSDVVQAQLTALKATWTNYSEAAQVLASFHSKIADPAPMAAFLAFCDDSKVASADAEKLVAGLAAPVLTGVVQSAPVKTQLKALIPTWNDFAQTAALLTAFHAKKPDFDVLAKFLKCCAGGPFSTADSRKLVDGLAEPILTGIANTDDLQKELKALAPNWANFAETAVILTRYHAKEATFTIMAKFLKGCAAHTWTQANAKKLVDGLTQPPLKELSETTDLQQKVQDISVAVWVDFTNIAEVVEEAHKTPARMTGAEKAEFLTLCKDDNYPANRAKRFITTSKQGASAAYTWAQRLTQVRNFRGHVQPAHGTNDLGGVFHDIRNYWSASVGAQIYVGVPENKLTHFKDGHSYEAFWFSVANCHRYGGESSMWPRGTNIFAQAAAAATNNAKINNAASGAGSTQHNAANYTIAYKYHSDDLAAAPPEIGVAVSQLYPKAAWMHHKLLGHLAEGIGRLKGYIV
jgi:hypothetical protein